MLATTLTTEGDLVIIPTHEGATASLEIKTAPTRDFPWWYLDAKGIQVDETNVLVIATEE
jgi:hypothetical protein